MHLSTNVYVNDVLGQGGFCTSNARSRLRPSHPRIVEWDIPPAHLTRPGQNADYNHQPCVSGRFLEPGCQDQPIRWYHVSAWEQERRHLAKTWRRLNREELKMIEILIKNIAAYKSSLAEAMKGVQSFKTFALEAASDFQNIASVAPSSRHLARAMLEGLSINEARTVVELGAGTGAITRVLLEALPARATLLAFEINPEFISHMEKRFSDPRLVLLNTPAENLGDELRQRGLIRIDAVISSLSLRFMPDHRQRILQEALAPFMDERSVYTQYQYVHGMRWENGKALRHSSLPFLREYFGSIQCRTVWRNLPPAYVFTCRQRFRDRRAHQVRTIGNARKAGSLAGEQA